MTREVPLSRGLFALVDDEDYERVMAFKWRVATVPWSKSHYAATGKSGTFMHHLILPKKEGFEIDHKNRKGYDNRRENLRYATRAQNMANRTFPSKPHGYRGILQKKNRWRASISCDGKATLLGSFKTAIEAARAYDEAAKILFGEFAVLNFSAERDWVLPLPPMDASVLDRIKRSGAPTPTGETG